MDLYISADAGQFTKTDAILISELHKVMDEGLKRVDFLDIKGAEFVTDGAYGADNLIRYMISEIRYAKISIFDGSFVLTFNVGKIDTFDIVEAHKTETLTKKYKEVAPKKKNIALEDVGAIERREEKLKKSTSTGSQILDIKNNLENIKENLERR